MNLIVPRKYSRILVCTSSTTILTVMRAIETNMLECALLSFLLLLTSMNYWRCPHHGWRRNTDMLLAALNIFWFSTSSFLLPDI